jgi:hypothetical protein
MALAQGGEALQLLREVGELSDRTWLKTYPKSPNGQRSNPD